ncbi:MAG TPA: flippase-like domain-containing protein [Acidimicrobiia bacterium]
MLDAQVAPADAPRVPALTRLITSFRGDGHEVTRHPGDIMRVILGTILFALCAIAASYEHLSRFEKNLFRLVNELPGAFEGVFTAATQAGTLWAVLVVAVVAFAWRRPPLVRDLAIAGIAAGFICRGVKELVERSRPAGYFHDVVIRGVVASGHGFPSTHAAVAAALATAAAPYLSRPGRRLAWAGVFVVALSRIYAGAHLPLDVVGGIALGWVVGAALHLVLGAPARSTPPEVIEDSLRGAGLPVTSIAPIVADARGSVPFFVHAGDGRTLFCKTLGREQRDSDALFKVWRYLAYRELEDEEPFSTPKRAVEHEAYLAMLASRAGVTTPELVLTTGMPDGAAALVEDAITGTTLDNVDPSTITDDLLDGIWREVAKLRAAHLAHRDLRLANVLVDADGEPCLIDFGFSEASASDRRLAQDVAQLLASTSIAVGATRAVASAKRVLGTDVLETALPLLQPLALASATRHELRAHHGLLHEVRAEAASACGTEEPELEKLSRVRLRTVLMVATLGVAVYLLIPQVGELSDTMDALKSAQWGWLVAAVLASAITYVGAGIGFNGTVTEHLALLRTSVVQLAGSFVNRLTPGSLGGIGLNVRYLQRAGIETPVAVAAVGLNSASGVAVHVVLLIAFSLAVGKHGLPDVHLPTGWLVLVVVAVALAAIGIVVGSAKIRERVVEPLRSIRHDFATVIRSPVKATEIFGGSLIVTLGNMLALAASLAAFGTDVHLVRVGFVYLAGAAVASAAPTPGGLGAMEAALVAGLTAVGVPSGQAVAGVLSFRLATFWLPTFPGWLAFRNLRRNEVI